MASVEGSPHKSQPALFEWRGPSREVTWWATEVRQAKRFGGLLGRHAVTRAIVDENGTLKRNKVPADDINKFIDPHLRYALRFADAAHANNLLEYAQSGSLEHAHFVEIDATDDGWNSRLVSATYSGKDDAFLADLRAQAPTHENN